MPTEYLFIIVAKRVPGKSVVKKTLFTT